MRLRELLSENEDIPNGSFHTRLHTKNDFDEIDPNPVWSLNHDLEQHELMDVINKAPLHHVPLSHPQFHEAISGNVQDDLFPETIKHYKKGIQTGQVPPAIGVVHGKTWKLNDGRHRASIAHGMRKTHMPVRMISKKMLDDKMKERLK